VTVPINAASRGAQLTHIRANFQAKLLWLPADFADVVGSLEVALSSLRAVWLIGEAGLTRSQDGSAEMRENARHPPRNSAPY
jgi:hypothetical protein